MVAATKGETMNAVRQQDQRSIGPETSADSPEDSGRGVIAISKEFFKEITADDVPGLAAQVAYHAIFSIPALIVMLITLAAVVENASNIRLANRLSDLITENAPDSTQDILLALVDNAVDQVGGGAASVGLAISLLVAIWAGSNGVGALVKAFNIAYDATETRSFPRMKAMSILLTIALGVVIISAFVIWVFGGRIGSWAASELELGSTFDWAWNISRFPVGVLVIVLVLALLYYFGPTVQQKFRWVVPGAVFATVAWGILVFGFSVYMQVANPGSAYGALGGMIVFLFFLYLTSLIFLIGAELNAVLARRFDTRYRASLIESNAAEQDSEETSTTATSRVATSEPSSLSALLIGLVTVLGIVLASVLGRRS